MHYRLTKDLVMRLCEELRDDLERQRVYTSTALTVEQQVLCALHFYATGSSTSSMTVYCGGWPTNFGSCYRDAAGRWALFVLFVTVCSDETLF